MFPILRLATKSDTEEIGDLAKSAYRPKSTEIGCIHEEKLVGGTCYWITGLPASGKTTLAKALKLLLERSGISTALWDGDELRKGLYADLGLSNADRSENIWRAGEVARLMVDAGLTVVCAFVSPFEKDRQRVRELFAPGKFAV